MRNCYECGGKRWYKTNKKEKVIIGETRAVLRYWRCFRCGHNQLDDMPQIRQRPKALYFDIETSPMIALPWSLKVPSKYLNREMIAQESFIISWAAGWVGERKIISACVTSKEAKNHDDKRIMKELFELMDNADYVIGHNNKKFDIKQVNWRFKCNGLDAPISYKVIDTLQLSRKWFAAPSHCLEYLSVKRGGNPKDGMEFDDWKRIVLNGDVDRLKKMERYNRGDVREGIAVFEDFARWIETSGGRVFA